LGTDSRGSSPSLSLWDDLLLLRELAPEQDPRLLWQMATRNGAIALGCAERLGSLEPGKLATFCLAQVETNSDNFSWEALLSPTTRLSRDC
jgi:cytosine/adenosine deaminase-related metal-dependent hydrolase